VHSTDGLVDLRLVRCDTSLVEQPHPFVCGVGESIPI
jgi:hypothetical protein